MSNNCELIISLGLSGVLAKQVIPCAGYDYVALLWYLQGVTHTVYVGMIVDGIEGAILGPTAFGAIRNILFAFGAGCAGFSNIPTGDDGIDHVISMPVVPHAITMSVTANSGNATDLIMLIGGYHSQD